MKKIHKNISKSLLLALFALLAIGLAACNIGLN